MARSFDFAAVPFFSFASGTTESMVFDAIALQGSGSFANATFSSAAEAFELGLADEEAVDFLPDSVPEDFPESDEHPAAVRTTGTTAAQARTRVRREADRCMVPSDVGDFLRARARATVARAGARLLCAPSRRPRTPSRGGGLTR
ncbi:hypothetical protein Slala03_36440 [Streptomyces lavendulae subsp. lavendulae]|nr:hypothetical protein Slala03_36440 [Streptomyces lavendulae subsp. lavendulae]GLW02185.1 hypothetical protein Slala05_58150 [Streptomyces lavendulae subsp. lavendulae]